MFSDLHQRFDQPATSYLIHLLLSEAWMLLDLCTGNPSTGAATTALSADSCHNHIFLLLFRIR